MAAAVDQTIDARGTACPGPTMELIKAMKGASVGTTIEVLSSEKGTGIDAEAWLKKVGQELVAVNEMGDYWSVVAKKIK